MKKSLVCVWNVAALEGFWVGGPLASLGFGWIRFPATLERCILLMERPNNFNLDEDRDYEKREFFPNFVFSNTGLTMRAL